MHPPVVDTNIGQRVGPVAFRTAGGSVGHPAAPARHPGGAASCTAGAEVPKTVIAIARAAPPAIIAPPKGPPPTAPDYYARRVRVDLEVHLGQRGPRGQKWATGW